MTRYTYHVSVHNQDALSIHRVRGVAVRVYPGTNSPFKVIFE